MHLLFIMIIIITLSLSVVKLTSGWKFNLGFMYIELISSQEYGLRVFLIINPAFLSNEVKIYFYRYVKGLCSANKTPIM